MRFFDTNISQKLSYKTRLFGNRTKKQDFQESWFSGPRLPQSENPRKQKEQKYLELARELIKLWNISMTVVPVVVGALGTVPKGFERKLSWWGRRPSLQIDAWNGLVRKTTRPVVEKWHIRVVYLIFFINLPLIPRSQGRRKYTGHFCSDACLILLNSVILLTISFCIKNLIIMAVHRSLEWTFFGSR